MWAGVALCLIFVPFRTYVQYKKSKGLFINDYWIFLATACHVATATLYQIAIPNMYEIVNISAQLIRPTAGFPERAAMFLRYQFATLLLLWTALWSVKFSLLFFFWRLFDSVQSHMRIFWWIMVGITASTYLVSLALQLKACDPVSDFFVLGMLSTHYQRLFDTHCYYRCVRCSEGNILLQSHV